MRLLIVTLAAMAAVFVGPAAAAQALAIPGADYSWFRPSANHLSSSGVQWVARYLVPASYRSGKALTASEATALRGRGVSIVLNYELAAGSARGGYEAGVRDAQRAETARREVGAPVLPIYFSIDYDERRTSAVRSYLSGVASVIGKARTGVYGGYYVVKAAADAGYPWRWQTYAWSGGRWDARAQLRQTHNGALWGGQGDKGIATTTEFGAWARQPGNVRYDDLPTEKHDATSSLPPTVSVVTVRRGDTLSLIARRFRTSVGALARLNGIRNPSHIYVGQRIRVSSALARPADGRVYVTVRRGDTVGAIAARYHTTVARVAALSGLRNANRIYVGQRLRVR